MARRSLDERHIRKLTKVGSTSFAVTIPIDVVRKLGWRERQKLVVRHVRDAVLIEDWKK